MQPPAKFLEEEQEGDADEQLLQTGRSGAGKRPLGSHSLPAAAAAAGSGKHLAGGKRPSSSSIGGLGQYGGHRAAGQGVLGSRKRQRVAAASGSRSRGQVIADDDDGYGADAWQGSDEDDGREEMKDFIVDELDAEDACGATAAKAQDR